MDAAIQLCLPYLRICEKSVLCLDENTLGSIQELPANCQVISNRFDVATSIENASFCDWSIEQKDLDCLCFRLSKEKAVNHYILNQSLNAVKDGGTIVFAGQKNQGIKSYAKALKKQFGNCEIEKHGMDYLCVLTVSHTLGQEPFDDQNYADLRPSIDYLGFTLLSKPGQFGWNKLDHGSLLLLNILNTELSKQPSKTILDLGCGYGLLSAGLALQHPLEKLIATDNNAAAVASCSANLQKVQEHKQTTQKGSDPTGNQKGSDPIEAGVYQVIADDCAHSIEEKVDTVVCNPPFHQGFDVESQLTDKFLKSARNRLVKSGRAYFVVNSFIGIEKKAKKYFNTIECLENNKQFKVLKFS